MCIEYMRPHFSTSGTLLCDVGGVKCQSFLKQQPPEMALKMIFKGSGCFQFPEAVVLLQRKKANALPHMVYYKLSLFYRSKNCHVQL